VQSSAQKQSQVPPPATNYYAKWRARHGFAGLLRDAADAPPERLLQAIWQHQRIQRTQLRTLDGQPVRVLHPGFGNVEGGPDFRGAIVQLGEEPPTAGDVEVDLRASGWHAHGHDQNPAFRKVILHVVWEVERRAGGLPTLALQPVLDAPLAELTLQLEHTSIRTLPENLLGHCSAPLRNLSEAARTELLREAAQVRLQNKAAQFRARAQQAGWEQALWEGLFRALGYKHNIWPMQHLAEQRERWQRNAGSVLTYQARLLGIGGLLPVELNRTQPGADDYLRRVWDIWWREREEFSDCTVPRSLWRFHGLRPANHPLRRLALAAHWLRDGGLATRLEHWCNRIVADKVLLASLTKILQVERDDYWSWHWTFRPARLEKPQPLLGEKRVTDLAVNVILPWLWARARAGRNHKLTEEIEHRFNAWPASEDNAVLRLARQRLLGQTPLRASGLRTAAAQQGLLQVVRDFCDHSNAACDGCGFPELVQNWEARPMMPGRGPG
jgi:hypothetical protein